MLSIRIPIIIALSAACSVVALGADPAPPLVATKAIPLEATGWEWMKRNSECEARVKKQAKAMQVLFVGDSITSGWGDIGKKIWEKEMAHLHAVNIGIAGNQTSHILCQIEIGVVNGINPRVAVLMIGVNNIMGSPKQSAEEIAGGIGVIVAKLRKKMPHTQILLLGTFPKDRTPATQARRKIEAINGIVAKLDDGKAIRFLNINNKLLDKDGNSTKEVSWDGVHLTEKGYEIWADAMRPLLTNMLADNSLAD